MTLDLIIDATASSPARTCQEILSRMPVLTRLVARGDPISPLGASLHAQLLARYGIDAAQAPIAALTALADGIDPRQDYWLRIDPVCLRATRTRMHLVLPPHRDISIDEARALADTLHAHFGALGHQLIIAHPERWHLRCARAQDLSTQAPSASVGLVTEHHLPAGSDAAGWRTLMTEAQMLLHGHAVNVAREARGQVSINAVWPWGGGRLPAPLTCPFKYVFSNDPVASGLGSLSHAALGEVPEDATAWFERLPEHDALVVLPLSASSIDDDKLHAIDRDWCSTVDTNLRRRRLREVRVTLVADQSSVARRIVPSHRWRFWRGIGVAKAHA